MAEHGDTTPSRVRATPPSSPEISDAVIETAMEKFSNTYGFGYHEIVESERMHMRPAIRAAISAAILADRESSRAEVARLTQERDAALSETEEYRAIANDARRLLKGDNAACDEILGKHLDRITAAEERARLAEEVLAKTIASIPVAMTAAAEKEREACAKIIDEQAPFLKDAVSSAVCASLSAAIRNRRDARNV